MERQGHGTEFQSLNQGSLESWTEYDALSLSFPLCRGRSYRRHWMGVMISLAAVYVAISSGATEQPHSPSAHSFLCPPQPQGSRATAPTTDTTKAPLTRSGRFVCRAGNVWPHPGLLCLSLAAELMHILVLWLRLPSLLLGYRFLSPVVSSYLVSSSASPCSHCLPDPGCSQKSL